jgi:hypothetical protein
VVDWWRETARADKLRLLAAAAVALLLFGGYQLQKHREEKPPLVGRHAPLPTAGPAADLTAVQLGYRPGPQSTLLRRIDSLLELLEADCPGDTRRELAALTLDARRKLLRAGIDVSPNAVLGGVVGSTNIGATYTCARFFAGYVARTRANPPSD